MKTMIYNGARLPIVQLKILSRKVEHLGHPEIPFHELLKAEHTIEHTPKGPRLIVRGKPKKLREWLASASENPNKVFFGETCKPAFVFQFVVTFADFRFISAPWGSVENPPLDYFMGAKIEKGSWLVLPDGLRVRGMTDADLPAAERTANAAQLAGDALRAVLDETRRASDNVDIALRKKEEAEALARDLQEQPMDATGDIYKQFRGKLTPRQSALYDALKETGGKQVQAGNRMHPRMSQTAVWNCINDVLRPAIIRAKLSMPTWLLTRDEKRRLRGAVNPPTRTPRGEITRDDADEAEGE